MKKIALLFIVANTFMGCTGTKIINGKEQGFSEFVLLNKNAKESRANLKKDDFEGWRALESDSFPGLRLIKWYETKSIKEKENV